MRDLVPTNARKAIARRSSAGSDEQYESPADIKPPYPERFTAEWWALRKRVLELIGRQQARMRDGEKLPAELVGLAVSAFGAAIEDEQSTREYEALDPEIGLHRQLSPALLTLREKDPARFAAIAAESRRFQSLGHRELRAALKTAFR